MTEKNSADSNAPFPAFELNMLPADSAPDQAEKRERLGLWKQKLKQDAYLEECYFVLQDLIGLG